MSTSDGDVAAVEDDGSQAPLPVSEWPEPLVSAAERRIETASDLSPLLSDARHHGVTLETVNGRLIVRRRSELVRRVLEGVWREFSSWAGSWGTVFLNPFVQLPGYTVAKPPLAFYSFARERPGAQAPAAGIYPHVVILVTWDIVPDWTELSEQTDRYLGVDAINLVWLLHIRRDGDSRGPIGIDAYRASLEAWSGSWNNTCKPDVEYREDDEVDSYIRITAQEAGMCDDPLDPVSRLALWWNNVCNISLEAVFAAAHCAWVVANHVDDSEPSSPSSIGVVVTPK